MTEPRADGLRGAVAWEAAERGEGLAAGVRHTLKLAMVRMQPHLYIRYAPVLRHLRACFPVRDHASVLEVGSGALGVTRFWPGPVTGVDLAFDGARLAHLSQVLGSATDLPFPDASFQVVVSVDMIEHLREEDRFAAIREMIRVSSGDVLLGVPCAPVARDVDDWGRIRCARAANATRSANRVKEIARRSAFLEQHEIAGYPTQSAIETAVRSALGEAEGRITTFGNESAAAWRFLLPSLVPLAPWSVLARRAMGALLMPLLLRSRAGGYYRVFFLIRRTLEACDAASQGTQAAM
jgi:hypothetical protein